MKSTHQTEKLPQGYRVLRKGRVSQQNARFFITSCSHERQPLLCSKDIPDIIFESLMSQELFFELIASVVMPDHIHIVIKLNNVNLPRAIQAFKSKSAIATNRSLMKSGPVWQSGYYDHKFRSDDDLASILSYLWNNPEIPGRHFR